jgi:hypothetical protein
MPENQTQPNNAGAANPSGERRIGDAEAGARDSASPGGESRSFESRPSDTEAAHASEEGDSVRTAQAGPIGGDLGRDPSKAPPSGLDPNAPGGQMEHQDPRHMNDLARVQGDDNAAGANDANTVLSNSAGPERQGGDGQARAGDRSFDPSHVEANLTREQGNGVGQRELNRQWDPTGADSTEHFGQMRPAGGGEGRSDVEHLHGAKKGGVEEA